MFTSLLLQASGAAGSATGGMADFVTDLSNTIGIDLCDEDIDSSKPTSFFAIPTSLVPKVHFGGFCK